MATQALPNELLRFVGLVRLGVGLDTATEQQEVMHKKLELLSLTQLGASCNRNDWLGEIICGKATAVIRQQALASTASRFCRMRTGRKPARH